MTLYKYVPPTRISIIQNKEIRFSPPSSFNDPFERLPAVRSLMTDRGFREFIQEYVVPEMGNIDWNTLLARELKKLGISPTGEMRERIKSIDLRAQLSRVFPQFVAIAKAAMTVSDPAIVAELSRRMMSNLSSQIGILCLSEVWDNLIMWSHYADSHKGFVIEFDGSHPFFDQRESATDPIRHLRKVTYQQERPFFSFYDPPINEDDYFFHLAERVFFTKSMHWQDEKEWRIILSFEKSERQVQMSDDEIIHLFQIPPDCIRRIILGCCSHCNLRNDFERLLDTDEYVHVELLQAQLDYSQVQLKARPILTSSYELIFYHGIEWQAIT